ncbi:mercury(II) reductase [Desulfoferrobacter suflitae]|uniref:mercury(II) reductase n=1 Tax=Desulfoferrobacter suflitae TaxID=2865782 RepID=UPI002164608C|nr:mercury(II) reductase [Desulfoferrobacter suflitae]MCK8604265.1 mercury(II) reductase [Desulfoferrobacter suflitae]
MKRFDCDLLILGAGSTAFAAALRARELGKTAIMTENRTVGGTCVNRGCLPSKNLIEAAHILAEANHPRYPGLTGEMRLAFADLIAQKDQLVEDYRRKKYERLIDGGIRIERGHALFIDPHTLEINGRRLRGEKVLIATGSRPVEPSIEGLDRVPYLTSDLLTVGEEQELKDLPESLLIVGGGYIALELGQMFQRFGTRVTILERSAQVLAHGYEPQVGQAIQEILVNEGVQILTKANVQGVEQENKGIVVHAILDNRSRSFKAQLLLVAAGRRSNTDKLSIEKAGVRLGERGEVMVDEHLRTSIEHIFAAGDVIGSQLGSQFATPVGSHDGGIAAHNALSNEDVRKVDHRVIPRALFTDPQIGLVGMTEEEAIAAGHPCWCNTVPMSLVPRAGAIRDTRGLIKMVADAETNEVLGVSMVGHNAGEVIHEAAMAMRFHAKLQDFIDLIHVYPTMAEALKIAAISRYKNPEKLSCCAD